MRKILLKSLMGKLVVSFVGVILLAIGIVGYLSYTSARDALQHMEFAELVSVRDLTSDRVLKYVEDAGDTAELLARRSSTRQGVRFLEDLYADFKRKASSGTDTGRGSLDVAAAEREWISRPEVASIRRPFQDLLEVNGSDGYDDVLLVDATNGQILYTEKRLSDFGENLMHGALKDTSLATVWQKCVKNQKPSIVPYSIYKPVNAPSMFLATPIYETYKGSRIIGVLVLRIIPAEIDRIMKLSQVAGQTAETHLVGPDLLMRTQSRFQTESTILKQKVDTEPVKLALQGKKGAMSARDYRGQKVFSAYAPVGLPTLKKVSADFDWVIISEIEEAEALESAVELAYRIAAVALAIAALVGLFTFLFARALTRPVVALAAHAGEVAQGNLKVEMPAQDRHDELGTLARSFHSMVENLREQTRKTMEGVNVLSSSASEISATVAQLAAGTSKTSSAVSETSTTAEEVRQASQLASDKARMVAESSHRAVQVSGEGKRATEGTIAKMHLIKEQMESIGETVVRLSEHSKAIEEIINAVQDLADQSNLLAVNASIEAARAGDHGKGFAVVAHEIKSLADQSREATQQVRGILDETRKWVAAVVMATEQGNRAVQAGVEQSVQAGRAIETLSTTVAESSQAASVIETSAGQQAVGIDQVSGAMVNIEQAMQQNLTGTMQLQSAAQKLGELGEELKRLVERYRV